MREIKFRAWDKKLNHWLNGKEIDSRLTFNSIAFPKVGNEFWIEDSGHYAIGSEIELVQYTGLKDKTGKEMYEGDIIKFPKGADYPADYYKPSTFYIEDDGGCCYSIIGISPEDVEGSDYCLADLDLGDCKVIGNIYESKELMEK